VNPESGHKDFTVVHINGVHDVAVDFCNCDSRVSNRQQLLQRSWFPVTVDYPKTCCTIQVLEQYHIITLTGKLSGYDFYRSLERLTDNTELNLPKVRFNSDRSLRSNCPWFTEPLQSVHASRPRIQTYQDDEEGGAGEYQKRRRNNVSWGSCRRLPCLSSSRRQPACKLERCRSIFEVSILFQSII
jgi:CxC2 like cysteine cluster associated with KDZ transposases